MAKFLIVGCGDVGYRVGLALKMRGHQVTGLKRSSPPIDCTFKTISADIRQASSLSTLPTDFDVVLFIVSADSRQAAAYQALYQMGLNNLLERFESANKKPWWLMVSSTSVYGQNQGEWVDETSVTQPVAKTAQWLVTAERRLWAARKDNCVVRFSGIYGPGRDGLLRRVTSGEAIQQQPPSFTNRIHRDDCVAVLLFLVEKQLAGVPLEACYLASDHDPAPLWEVMNWLAMQYAYPAPQALTVSTDASQNKRCRNTRLIALGYRFLYPSYQDGYRQSAEAEDQAYKPT